MYSTVSALVFSVTEVGFTVIGLTPRWYYAVHCTFYASSNGIFMLNVCVLPMRCTHLTSFLLVLFGTVETIA